MAEMFTTDASEVPDELIDTVDDELRTEAIDNHIEAYIEGEIERVVDDAGVTYRSDSFTYEDVVECRRKLAVNDCEPTDAVLSGTLIDRILDDGEFKTTATVDRDPSNQPLIEACGINIHESAYMDDDTGLMFDATAIFTPPGLTSASLLVQNPDGVLEIGVDEDVGSVSGEVRFSND